MNIIDRTILDALSAEAASLSRRRKNLNLHTALEDPIQRLCNAVEPGTYVRPHHHVSGRWELFMVLRGVVRVLTFAEDGHVLTADVMGPGQDTVLIEIPGNTWHSMVSLQPGTVFFEVKPGPYSPASDKDFAAWAPREGEPRAVALEAWMQTAQPGDQWR
ncbi:MAG: WbuC family cupin fold metalloprotein [Rhodospirillaceae bacterium]